MYGLTMGVLPFESFNMEVGADYMAPVSPDANIQFNAKVGTTEGKGLPFGWSAGIFGLGFDSGVNDYNVLHFELGKNTPIGIFSAGVYYGLSDTLLIDVNEEQTQLGFMVGYLSPDIKVGKYIDKIVLAADIMTGNTALGAFGGGIYIYFTPAISLLTGPVIPIEKAAFENNSLLWTMQLDVDIDFNATK